MFLSVIHHHSPFCCVFVVVISVASRRPGKTRILVQKVQLHLSSNPSLFPQGTSISFVPNKMCVLDASPVSSTRKDFINIRHFSSVSCTSYYFHETRILGPDRRIHEILVQDLLYMNIFTAFRAYSLTYLRVRSFIGIHTKVTRLRSTPQSHPLPPYLFPLRDLTCPIA